MKNILVINGHPNLSSFNAALFDAYVQGARASGVQVEELVIARLQFNPNLQYGYQKRIDLEPDLLQAWEKVQAADHLVWLHPVWWGGLPALTKGFIDRLFLPGMAFKYRDNSVWWDKLLQGKTAHIISTLDQPGWFYYWFFGNPSVNQLKKATLEFCGVKVKRVSYIGPIRGAKPEKLEWWLKKVSELGRSLKL